MEHHASLSVMLHGIPWKASSSPCSSSSMSSLSSQDVNGRFSRFRLRTCTNTGQREIMLQKLSFLKYEIHGYETGRGYELIFLGFRSVLSTKVSAIRPFKQSKQTRNVPFPIFFMLNIILSTFFLQILPKDGNFGDLPSSHRKGKVEKLSFVCSAKTKKHRSNLKTTICLHIKNSKNIRVRGITNTYYCRTDISKEQ